MSWSSSLLMSLEEPHRIRWETCQVHPAFFPIASNINALVIRIQQQQHQPENELEMFGCLFVVDLFLFPPWCYAAVDLFFSFLVWLLRCFYLLVGPKWMKKPEACLATLRKIRFQVNTERIGSKREQKWAPLLIVFKRNRKEFACRLLNV